ncbi:MAG: hypothetical protein U0R52_02270 [Solirubrobacterales bacterium]
MAPGQRRWYTYNVVAGRRNRVVGFLAGVALCALVAAPGASGKPAQPKLLDLTLWRTCSDPSCKSPFLLVTVYTKYTATVRVTLEDRIAPAGNPLPGPVTVKAGGRLPVGSKTLFGAKFLSVPTQKFDCYLLRVKLSNARRSKTLRRAECVNHPS